MSESDIEADYASDTESTSIVESNVPESEPKMTNSEFISLLFSITLRLIIYGAFTVFLLIFVHGKSMDKVGYDRIIKALTLEDQNPGVMWRTPPVKSLLLTPLIIPLNARMSIRTKYPISPSLLIFKFNAKNF